MIFCFSFLTTKGTPGASILYDFYKIKKALFTYYY